MMAGVLIACLNKSTLVSPDDFFQAVGAVWHQVRYHAGPLWSHHAAPVIAYTDEAQIPVGAYKVLVVDDADMAGALGYHDEGPDGLPYARVFVHTSESAGVPWTSVLSHEVLEALIDPACQLWAQDFASGTLFAVEVGDPVEGDSYEINGVAVSNFVGPAWFDRQSAPTARRDWLRTTPAPFTMSPNGYVIVMTGGEVSQRFGDSHPEERRALKAHPASRTYRRLSSAVPVGS